MSGLYICMEETGGMQEYFREEEVGVVNEDSTGAQLCECIIV